jgi:hypothetical protein
MPILPFSQKVKERESIYLTKYKKRQGKEKTKIRRKEKNKF